MKIRHPENWESRTRERFLLCPKRVRNETRWLERARWREKFLAHDNPPHWEAEFWIDTDSEDPE